MAGPPELCNFVNKFINLWQSGKCARLAVKCQDGKATVNLQLQLGGDTLAKPKPKPRPSPSRQRRSARRGLARAEAAAGNAAPPPTKADTAVQAGEPSISTVDVAVEATDATITEDAVVQTDAEFPHLQNITSMQASPHLPQYVSAGQVDPRPGRDHGDPSKLLQASYRSDEKMQNQINLRIPQLDGLAETFNIKCDHCSKPFETTKQLQHHEEKNQFGCD